MVDSDDILQGFLAATFVICGISAIGYCIRNRMKNQTGLKQSPSMEDLTSVSTEDPQT